MGSAYYHGLEDCIIQHQKMTHFSFKHSHVKKRHLRCSNWTPRMKAYVELVNEKQQWLGLTVWHGTQRKSERAGRHRHWWCVYQSISMQQINTLINLYKSHILSFAHKVKLTASAHKPVQSPNLITVRPASVL